MRAAKMILYFVLILVSIVAMGCFISPTFKNMVKYNFADINDHKIFPNRPLQASTQPYHYTVAPQALDMSKLVSLANGNFERFMEERKTVAFLVIQNDSIKYEHYFSKYDDKSVVPSFSMAKSVTSILIGCALQDGLIKNIQEPITNYIPNLRSELKAVTIEHLLQMTSGIYFNESYWNPTGEAAKFYYGNDLRKYITLLKLEATPGTRFRYMSGNTQLLGFVLEAALKGKPITQYLQERLWTPLGMEFEASWSVDKKEQAMEKTFCCLNARARDFAKIGSLYLHKGSFNGNQIINPEWVAQSTKIDTANGAAWYYQHQWWLPSFRGDFMAQGILGQFVYVNPDKNLVIVRLGKDLASVDWESLFIEIAKGL
jgi:CubicO group peptidase (beta-lactamase class C family)